MPFPSGKWGLSVGKVEGIFYNLNIGGVILSADRHNIESRFDRFLFGGFQITQGNHGNLALLLGRYGRLWISETKRSSRFNFNKNQYSLALGDNIDFSQTGAVILGNNPVTVFFEVRNGKGFTFFTKLLPAINHFNIPS